MKNYTVVDNHIPSRAIKIKAKNKNDAIDKGAFLLKTWNVRVYEIKSDKKEFPGE